MSLNSTDSKIIQDLLEKFSETLHYTETCLQLVTDLKDTPQARKSQARLQSYYKERVTMLANAKKVEEHLVALPPHPEWFMVNRYAVLVQSAVSSLYSLDQEITTYVRDFKDNTDYLDVNDTNKRIDYSQLVAILTGRTRYEPDEPVLGNAVPNREVATPQYPYRFIYRLRFHDPRLNVAFIGNFFTYHPIPNGDYRQLAELVHTDYALQTIALSFAPIPDEVLNELSDDPYSDEPTT